MLVGMKGWMFLALLIPIIGGFLCIFADTKSELSIASSEDLAKRKKPFRLLGFLFVVLALFLAFRFSILFTLALGIT